MILQSDKSPCAREATSGSAVCRRKRIEAPIYMSRAQAKMSDTAGCRRILGQFPPLLSAIRVQLQQFCPGLALPCRLELAKSLTLLTLPCQKCQTGNLVHGLIRSITPSHRTKVTSEVTAVSRMTSAMKDPQVALARNPADLPARKLHCWADVRVLVQST
jgi:hypothetical protein